MKPSLNYAAHMFIKLREEMLEAFPELADDEQALADTLEGESDLPDMLTAIITTAREDLAMADALKSLIDGYGDRQSRLKQRAQKKKDIVLQIMGDAAIRKIPSAGFTISRRNTAPGVHVIDEDLIPKVFLRIKTSPDLKAIKEALQDKGTVPGCTLKNASETLSIRT